MDASTGLATRPTRGTGYGQRVGGKRPMSRKAVTSQAPSMRMVRFEGMNGGGRQLPGDRPWVSVRLSGGLRLGPNYYEGYCVDGRPGWPSGTRFARSSKNRRRRGWKERKGKPVFGEPGQDQLQKNGGAACARWLKPRGVLGTASQLPCGLAACRAWV